MQKAVLAKKGVPEGCGTRLGKKISPYYGVLGSGCFDYINLIPRASAFQDAAVLAQRVAQKLKKTSWKRPGRLFCLGFL